MEQRFPDPKKSKVKRLNVPGPGNYDMICRWPKKTNIASVGKEDEKGDWLKSITKGISKSIYY